MKVFRCDYLPHTSEEHPEVLSYLFGFLSADEVEAYKKHSAQSVELGVAYLEHLMSHDEEDDRLYDEDIYYYLHEGVDKCESPNMLALPQKIIHTGEPEEGDVYRGLVYDDDLTIIVKEVYEYGV